MARAMYTTPATRPTHVALCIGNGAYASSPLRNARNDAEDVAALCGRLGFATELVLDGSLDGMLAAVDAFVHRLHRGGVAIFFYAGVPARAGRAASVRWRATHSAHARQATACSTTTPTT